MIRVNCRGGPIASPAQKAGERTVRYSITWPTAVISE